MRVLFYGKNITDFFANPILGYKSWYVNLGKLFTDSLLQFLPLQNVGSNVPTSLIDSCEDEM